MQNKTKNTETEREKEDSDKKPSSSLSYSDRLRIEMEEERDKMNASSNASHTTPPSTAVADKQVHNATPVPSSVRENQSDSQDSLGGLASLDRILENEVSAHDSISLVWFWAYSGSHPELCFPGCKCYCNKCERRKDVAATVYIATPFGSLLPPLPLLTRMIFALLCL